MEPALQRLQVAKQGRPFQDRTSNLTRVHPGLRNENSFGFVNGRAFRRARRWRRVGLKFIFELAKVKIAQWYKSLSLLLVQWSKLGLIEIQLSALNYDSLRRNKQQQRPGKNRVKLTKEAHIILKSLVELRRVKKKTWMSEKFFENWNLERPNVNK